MLILTTTATLVEFTTANTNRIDFVAAYADHTTTTFTPGANAGASTTATTTTVIAAPGASTQRVVKFMSFVNRGTGAQTLHVNIDVSGSDLWLTTDISLQPGESLTFADTVGWRVLDANGRITQITDALNPSNGYTQSLFKTGTNAEANGVRHLLALSGGSPPAWSPGTAGVAGRATDGTTSGDAGSITVLTDAYLTGFVAGGTQASAPFLIDVLWVNDSLSPTTTTAQAVGSATFAARDLLGSSLGLGVDVGILVTGSTTSAVITTITLDYTNSDGVAGRTGTIPTFPATAQVGSLVPFQLQSGDRGIRSIQNITLGTSMAAGSFSLVAFRHIAQCPTSAANFLGTAPLRQDSLAGRGVKVYQGACLLSGYIPTTSTALNQTGLMYFET